MKAFLFHKAILFFLFFLLGSGVKGQTCTGCTQTISSSSSTNYTVNTGETYCFAGGTYTGTITVNSGGTVCVATGATFNPTNNSPLNGTIINNGTMNFNYYSSHAPTIINNGTFASTGLQGFAGTFINYGTVNINSWHTFLAGSTIVNNSTFNMNSNGNLSGNVENNETGVFQYTVGGAQLNGQFYNYGHMIFRSSVNVNSATYMTNDGLLEFKDMTSAVNFDGPMLTNNDRVLITGSAGTLALNSSISQLHNNGMIIASENISHNAAGSRVVNNCRIVAKQYFVGNGTSENYGLIWVSDYFQLEGYASMFVQSQTGFVRGVRFRNSGDISGYGRYYFTGNTNFESAGTIVGNSSSEPIQFYDVSQTGSQIFDAYVPSNPGTNIIRPDSMTPLDTTGFDCGAIPPSTAGYPPTTLPFDEERCAPETIILPLSTHVTAHAPIGGNPFTIQYSSTRLFQYSTPANPTNNSTNLVIPGKGTFSVDTSNGDITFAPEPAFTVGVVEAEYRISNSWSGTPPNHPSGRTRIRIEFKNCTSTPRKVISNPMLPSKAKRP